MPKSPSSKNLVRPSAKDVLLVGRQSKRLYNNFIANRRFRRLIDMFIQEYVESDSRTQKSRLVKHVVDIALKSGYRFLAQDEWGIFAPIPWSGVQKKVGHSFRDRKAQVAHHIAMNLKTRDQLLEEGIELIDYVELVTPPSSTRELVVNHFAYPPGYIEKPGRKLQAKTNRPSTKHVTAIDAASNVLNLSSKPLRLVHGAISKTGELSMRVSSGAAEEALTKKAVATRMTEHQDDFATQHGNNRTQVQAAHNFSMQPTTEGIPTLAQTLPSTTRMGTPEKQIGKRYFISLADIVVPTLQEGHEMLPIAGGWTFFPLPEFRSKKVDLGTHAKGWQLQLAPVSTEEESILLNVPARFILNGCHNPLKSFAANKI